MKLLVLNYLRILAKIQIFKVKPIIIGVGGASGKTSLSGLIALILSEKYRVLDTKGKNSFTGIPLSIFGIKLEEYTFFYWLKVIVNVFIKVIFNWKKYDVFVAEMGIDGPFEPKNMSYLLKIIRPKVGVLTNISFEHSEYFEKGLFEGQKEKRKKILSLTADQEALLLKSLPKNGLAVLNLDDPEIKKINGIKANVISVSSKDESADFFIKDVDTKISEFIVRFFSKGLEYKIKVKNLLPNHYANSFLFAIAVSNHLGFSIDESIKILENKFSLPPGRISIFNGEKDSIIIDSTYNNATLDPIIDILELLKKIAGKRRKVAIIGDMRELGVISREYHEKVANKLLETSDLAIIIGPMMQEFAAPILKKNNHKFYTFETFSEAKKMILNLTEKNDIILVKSSQNTLFLERVVEMLLKDKKDVQKLCRRGKYWDKKRKETL